MAERIRIVLLSQYASFAGRADVFMGLSSDIDSMKQQSINQHSNTSTSTQRHYTHFDPKRVWYLYKDTAPELSSVAIALLSIVPSEAAVERSFSMQDMVHSKRRNKLHDISVEAEMFIKFNSRALDSTSNPGGNYIELSEDDIEIESDAKIDLFVMSVEEKANEDAEEKEQKNDDAHGLDERVASDDEREDEQMEDEQQEQMEDEPLNEEVSCARFVQHYISLRKITCKYRWNVDKENHLLSEMTKWSPPLRDTVRAVKEMIMIFVNPRQIDV
jgi:hypothetical protein